MARKLFVVQRSKHFTAVHNLEGKLKHAHDFVVTFEFAGYRQHFQPNHDSTMLLNYFEIDKIWNSMIYPCLINDETGEIALPNSSCEIIADWIYDKTIENSAKYMPCWLQSVSIFDGDVTVTVKC